MGTNDSTRFSLTEHMLSGAGFLAFIKIISQDASRLSWRYWHRVLYVGFTTLALIPLRWFERLIYDRKTLSTKISKDPIFIIGHWRSGTTFLHNLLTADPQFGYASTYQCFLPGVFCTGSKFLKAIHAITLPKVRPVDNFQMHPDMPQEEEFAMLGLSSYSFYRTIFFPSQMVQHFSSYALMNKMPVDKWRKSYLYFLKKVTRGTRDKQLVLKNPVNTVRIKHLLTLFPNAKFIYIKRDPAEVLNSTFLFFSELISRNCFEYMDKEMLKTSIITVYKQFMEEYELQKKSILPGNIIEIQFDDLVRSSNYTVSKIYTSLKLNGNEIKENNLNGRHHFAYTGVLSV